MTRIATGTLVVALIASAGMANIDRSGYTIYEGVASALDTSFSDRGGSTIYSDMNPGPNGYVAFAHGGGVAGSSDYASIATGNQNMKEFKFIGGVNTVGTVVFFDFFDTGANFVDGFGVALPSAGDFIWTVTLSGTTVADAGFVQMTVDDAGVFGAAGLGRWFLGNNGADIGSAGATDVDIFNFNYEMTVPAPGAMALLGLGGLVATRRRR